MKATELMIGDLINGFGVVRRVTSIHGFERPQDEGLLTTMVPGCEFPESNLSFRPCYAWPIPLTGEILEKNGFHRSADNNYEYVYEYRDDDTIICCPKGTGCINAYGYITLHIGCASIEELPTDYVHELQHALRLCGIDKEIVL